jgi:acyl-homoserine-lactone acylase
VKKIKDYKMINFRNLCYLVVLSILLIACGDSDNYYPPEPKYSAQITRTEYGIPHIKADDWGSLGYGHGYSYARDNYCVLMREIVFANGQSAELMGEAEGNLDSDFIFKFLNSDEQGFQSKMDLQPEYLKQMVEGYVRGMNRYLSETGADNLPEGAAGCRNAEWVRDITALDLWKYMRKIALQGSSDNGTVRRAIIDATGPDNQENPPVPVTQFNKAINDLSSGFSSLRSTQNGSNAIALGRNATQSGKGMLLGNPHQPWQGSGRWYQVHLTIPGEYDVMGATLQGMPMVGIGFNGQLAWTHTVSFANRFTLYELELNPDNPMQYLYDDEWRDITSQTVAAKVKLGNGNIETRSHTFYSSHYGLIVNLKSQSSLLDGWPIEITGTILSIRDANLENVRGVDQWIKMGQAQNMDEFINALKLVGNPSFHTLAADRDGNAFYGDISAIPHVTQQQLNNCINGLIGPLLAASTNNTIITLDGSTSDCEWGSDDDSPAESDIYGYSSLPKFVTEDYAANSNNSYWLSDANNPLTGFPVVMGAMGHEGEQQFIRTQLNHQMVAERLDGTDGLSGTPKFTMDTLQQLMYSNRVLGAEITMDDIISICDTMELNVPMPNSDQQRALQACSQLEAWDKRVNLDSRGAHLFTEFWNALPDSGMVIDNEDLWRVDFDPDDPIHTPRGFDTSIPVNHDLVIDALSEAVQTIEDAGLTIDEPFGDVQFFARNNDIIPIHGGMDAMGVFGVIKVRLEQGGYQNITGGNSYIQTVTWDESGCPIAEGILTHSQSTDPDSPYYGDQTPVYSAKEWISLPFCEEDIEAARIGETLTLEN